MNVAPATLCIGCLSLFFAVSSARSEPETSCPAYQEAVSANFAPLCLGGGDGKIWPVSPSDAISTSFIRYKTPPGGKTVRFVWGKDRRAYLCRSGDMPLAVLGTFAYRAISDAEYERRQIAGLPTDTYPVSSQPIWRISCQGTGDLFVPALQHPIPPLRSGSELPILQPDTSANLPASPSTPPVFPATAPPLPAPTAPDLPVTPEDMGRPADGSTAPDQLLNP